MIPAKNLDNFVQLWTTTSTLLMNFAVCFENGKIHRIFDHCPAFDNIFAGQRLDDKVQFWMIIV
jgi:hypothetical protein